MLPGLDGFEIVKKVREKGIDTPVIMLTAKSQVSDKIQGLDLGADKTEFLMLECLMINKGQILPKDTIISKVWGIQPGARWKNINGIS